MKNPIKKSKFVANLNGLWWLSAKQRICAMTDRYCPYCGKELPESSPTFCPYCGKKLTPDISPEVGRKPKKQKSHLEEYVNSYIGNDRRKGLNWRVLFTGILKKHTFEEGERIFIRGTQDTTPPIDKVSGEWPYPWLYFRVFISLLIAYFLLYLGCDLFENINLLPGLIILGALLVPVSAVILFYEMNVFCDVSIYMVFHVFLIGGCAALVLTLVLFSFISPEKLDYTGALLTGIIEEVGKAAIIYVFLKRMNPRKILVGLLIGATVGAGFAAFETAGYSLRILLANGWEPMLSTIFVRNLLAPGGHIAWGAISGAAIILACRESYSIDSIVSFRFLRLFLIPVILHFLWDSPLADIGSDFFLMYIFLIIIVWAFVLGLIDMGLAEVPSQNADI